GGADVGDGGAGRQVPVHAADVVAGGVQPALGWLAAAARHEALVVAVEEAVELAGDGHLQLGEPVLPPDDIGGFDHDACSSQNPAGAAPAPLLVTTLSWLGASRGARTVPTTRFTTCSALIPSAIASYDSSTRWRSPSGATS